MLYGVPVIVGLFQIYSPKFQETKNNNCEIELGHTDHVYKRGCSKESGLTSTSLAGKSLMKLGDRTIGNPASMVSVP